MSATPREQQTAERLVSKAMAVPWLERGEDWRVFLGPQGNGHSRETGVEASLWQPHPPIVWSIPLGTSYGGPAVVGQRLYQFDRYGDQERLTCYDVMTAGALWHWQRPVRYDDAYGYNNGPRCSPIVDGELIFLYGVAGDLYCIDAQSHELLWNRNTIRDYRVVPNFFGVGSNPVVHGDKLLVMIGGSPQRSLQLPMEQLRQVEPDGSAIVAFDKRTGKELYRVGDDLSSYASLTVQTVAGQATGLAFLRGGLLAFDPDTGQKRFEFPWRADMLESVNAAVPVTDGRRVLVSESYEIGSVLLDAVQQPWTVAWQDAGPRNRCRFRAHWATPVLIDGYLYGCNGRNPQDSDFRCIRWEDGQIMWADRRHERCSVLAVDGYLVVFGEHGRLDLVRPNSEKLDTLATCDLSTLKGPDGQPLLEYPCWAAPVLSHGLLYLRGNNRLVCLQLIAQ
ncbi:MAG: PQQ-binding-like beta-propeller repeat protein [Pirellulaceae bacterium]|nr:PQQ-binding-like beta-propeller repeat protein [Pirellulaceae bacterium]